LSSEKQIIQELISSHFRSWFIDFDPTKAKANGELPYGMNEEIAALFPDAFEDSELGSIPVGWKINRFSDILDLKYGSPLKSEERVQGEYPVIRSNGIVGVHNEYLVEGPGIVIGRKGNPGFVNWVDDNFYPIDTTFFVKPKNINISLNFIFHVLNHASLPWFSSDSAVPGINRKVILQLKFICPPNEIIKQFERVTDPSQYLLRVRHSNRKFMR